MRTLIFALNFQQIPASRRNFLDGWEREGASVTVYWRGKLVVDLHTGYADRSALAKWNERTQTVLFSVTKASMTGGHAK